MLQTLTTVPLALVVDIGGYTMDYIRIKKGRSDLASCDSLENGVIMLYNKIISKVRAAQDILLSEEEIDAILLRQSVQGLQEVVPVVERCAQEAHPLFVEDIRANVKGYETLYRVAQNSR